MRKSVLILGVFGLLVVIQEATGTLMLGSLLMALKGGMFATKMGLGGLLAMAMAGTKTNDGIATGGTYAYGRRRAIRSVTSVSEIPLELKELSNGTHLSAEKLAESLNNMTLPSTRRMMRQVAILDQLSCLPKVLCGLNTREPNTKTSVINDYGYLIKFLFERDQDEDDEQEEEEEEDVDDDEADEDLARAAALAGKKTKKKNSKNRSGLADVDDQEEEIEDEDDQLDAIARDDILQSDPEMMLYILTEMSDKMKKMKKGGYPHHKPYPDLSYLPGYNAESYNTAGSPNAVNTDSSQAELKGNGFSFGSPNYRLKIGESDKESSGGFLSSLLPSFSFQSIQTPKTKASSNDDDPFATDPFFANFKRSIQFPMKYIKPQDFERNYPATARPLGAQRLNSKFKPVDTTFIDLKREQLLTSSDPVLKYRIAAEVGQKTKSSRQCRMLFAKCPYEHNEIMTMINNVKKVVTANTAKGQVADKVTSQQQQQQQNPQAAATTSQFAEPQGAVSSITTGTGGNRVNLQRPAGMGSGVTSISHELDSGDKVEIMLKFQPKPQEEIQTKPIFHIIPAPYERVPDRDLINATQSLYETKKAIQMFQTINRLYNSSNLYTKNAPSSPRPTRKKQQEELFAAFVAQKVNELNKGTTRKPKPESGGVDDKKPAAAASESVESGSNSKSSEEVVEDQPNKPQPEEESQEDEKENDDEGEDDAVLDDHNPGARHRSKFRHTPPGNPPGGIYSSAHNSRHSPTLTLVHFGDKPKSPHLPKFPRGPPKRIPGNLPPRPTRYKIVRRQRAEEDSTV